MSKSYTRRDSATTVLRKMGVHSRDYNAFIEAKDDGTVVCHITRAKNHLMSLAKPVPAASKPKKLDAKQTAAKKLIKVGVEGKSKSGISATARKMISEGSTNQEVWTVLKAQFDLDDSKRHYPTWYRCEMKRTGLLPKD